MVGNAWPLQRVLVGFVGLAYLMILGQVYLFHDRQNFRHGAMVLPVVGAGIIAVTSFAAVFANVLWRLPLLLVFTLGIVDGLIGLYYHFVGVGTRVGGYVSQNFEKGPPVILPVMFAALGLLGLIALWWR